MRTYQTPQICERAAVRGALAVYICGPFGVAVCAGSAFAAAYTGTCIEEAFRMHWALILAPAVVLETVWVIHYMRTHIKGHESGFADLEGAVFLLMIPILSASWPFIATFFAGMIIALRADGCLLQAFQVHWPAILLVASIAETLWVLFWTILIRE